VLPTCGQLGWIFWLALRVSSCGGARCRGAEVIDGDEGRKANDSRESSGESTLVARRPRYCTIPKPTYSYS
jgi:hypothetical protein